MKFDRKELLVGNDGIDRIKMPQLSGKPVPGSLAANLPRTAYEGGQSVDILPLFCRYLRRKDIEIQPATQMASKLEATQDQLDMAKVKQIAQSIRQDGWKQTDPMVVSETWHIIDGHHRWAALMEVDPSHDILCNVICAPTLQIISLANRFANRWGVEPESVPQTGKEI